jgi:hypothetical protein
VETWDAAAKAAARADAASRRTREIADRLTRLAQGRRPGLSDVQLAQERADEAARRAQESLQRSIDGHERAARSHERAAEAHEEAVRRRVGDAAEHARRARTHRDGAVADLQEAESDRRRLTPDPRREDASAASGGSS